MKGNLDNQKDVDKIKNSGKSGGMWVRINKGEKKFVRLISKDVVSEWVHVLELGKNNYVSIPCLGGIEKGGYAPNICPICEETKKHWDKIKELKANPKFSSSKKLQVEANFEKDRGKEFQPKKSTVMIAVEGEASIKKVGGKKVTEIKFESDGKYISFTEPQFDKLTLKIFEDYPFMKSTDDLINRNLLFSKVEKDGKKTGKYTEVDIKPSKTKTKAPKVSSIPDLDDVFDYKKEDEIKKILNSYLRLTGDDSDDVDKDEIDEVGEIQEDVFDDSEDLNDLEDDEVDSKSVKESAGDLDDDDF